MRAVTSLLPRPWYGRAHTGQRRQLALGALQVASASLNLAVGSQVFRLPLELGHLPGSH